jgi:hypothetical protein
MKIAVQIRLERPVEVLLGQILGSGYVQLKRRVVYENIEFAECIDRFANRFPAKRPL